ncbi:MAG: hypothetical protein VCD50_02270 [Alphaproteobacteria bacterium]
MYVLSSLDDFIQEAVQTYGSEITKTKVTLDQVEIDLTSGRGALRGLTVGNPQGFNTPSAFVLGSISITIDSSTISDDVIVINEIAIDGPEVTYELGENGNNIDTIKSNVEAYMAQFGEGGAANDDKGPKMIIDDLYIRGGAVNVSASFLGGKTLESVLPDLHLEDIGREEKGAWPQQVAEQVIAAITEGTNSVVSGLDLEGMMGNAGALLEGGAADVGKVLEGVTSGGDSAIQNVTKDASQAIEGAGQALEGAAGDATKALGNLFGGSSD